MRDILSWRTILKVLVVEGGRRDSVAEGLVRSASMVRILQGAGLEAILAHVKTDNELVKYLSRESPDIVFCTASSLPDSQGAPCNTHGTLEATGFPFIGSSSKAIELALSKDALKRKWRETGIRTPDYFVVKALEAKSAKDISDPVTASGFPYIVKPCREGDSRGISDDSVVTTFEALRQRIAFIHSNYGDALVEHFLGTEPDCREYSVALIGSPRRGFVLPISISFRDGRKTKVVTHEDKSFQATLVAPVSAPGERWRIERFVRSAFIVAGVRDYARCDIIEAGGELYAIEINGQPMIPDRWFEACASGIGLGPDAYPVAIVMAAVTRLREEGRNLLAIGNEKLALSPPEIPGTFLGKDE